MTKGGESEIERKREREREREEEVERRENETWWWNEEMLYKLKTKYAAFNAWQETGYKQENGI